jgi:hypothetical protein
LKDFFLFLFGQNKLIFEVKRRDKENYVEDGGKRQWIFFAETIFSCFVQPI